MCTPRQEADKSCAQHAVQFLVRVQRGIIEYHQIDIPPPDICAGREPLAIAPAKKSKYQICFT